MNWRLEGNRGFDGPDATPPPARRVGNLGIWFEKDQYRRLAAGVTVRFLD
jgi:hypothetical protein